VDETQHGSPYRKTKKTEGSQRVYAKERPFEEGKNLASTSRRNRKSLTQAKSDRRPLGAALPLSEPGQRLTDLFPNGWDWIYAESPARDNKPEWETIKRYPLTPIEQWSLHQDPTVLVGIRPLSVTRWGILDIDRHSKYHPAQNPEALQTICNTLQDIGITRTLLNQSSHSGGLHLYIPLPEPVSSYWLSITLKYHLEAAGIQIRSGQCELFPNPKRYIPKGQGFSYFNGIRMPMQPGTGFIPLDQDLTPLSWTLEDWLNAFDVAAAHQDIHQLKSQIEDARHNKKIRTHRNPHSIDTWRDRIHEEKVQGWTGPGQTNEKLKAFACEARVFLNMDSEQQIAEHIEQTAQHSPGFQEHSHHTHNIAQRSREIATWAMRYYWPLGATPSRDTGYHTPPQPIASFSYHQAKREAAQERIRAAVAQLQTEDLLPATATERAALVIERGNVSKKTLYLAINKPLWHPDHILSQPHSIAQPQPEPASLQPEQNPEQIASPQQPEPLKKGLSLQPFRYVGFVIHNLLKEAAAALTSQGQKAAVAALPLTEIPNRGGQGGNPAISPQPIANFAELKTTLPESLQAKIAQAERQRKRDQRREQQRRQRAQSRQLQLHLPQSSKADPIAPTPARLLTPWSAAARHSVELPLRSPTAAERSDFELWYALAQQFKLVTDYRWEDCEYWVLCKDEWETYCELSGTFTVRRLKRYLYL
jgi:hypothetical protein